MPLVDLDDPVELRARWAALAAVAHATGRDRIWWADDQGLHYEDSRGNDLRLILIADGRAVLFGYHYEESRTADEGVYADLLAGAPDWIGQPEVRHRLATGQLGFVYGHFAGTWARAEYPGDPWQPLEDGFLALGSWLTDDREAEYEVAEQVLSWIGGDHLAPDELRFGAMGLIRASGTTGLGPEELGQFFAMLRGAPVRPDGGPPDLQAGAMAAAMFGGPSAARAEQAAQAPPPQQQAPFVGPAPVAQSPYVGASPYTEDSPYVGESAFVGESPFVGPSPFAPQAGDAAPAAESDEADLAEDDDTTGFFELFEDDEDDGYDEDGYEEYEDEQVAYDQPRYGPAPQQVAQFDPYVPADAQDADAAAERSPFARQPREPSPFARTPLPPTPPATTAPPSTPTPSPVRESPSSAPEPSRPASPPAEPAAHEGNKPAAYETAEPPAHQTDEPAAYTTAERTDRPDESRDRPDRSTASQPTEPSAHLAQGQPSANQADQTAAQQADRAVANQPPAPAANQPQQPAAFGPTELAAYPADGPDKPALYQPQSPAVQQAALAADEADEPAAHRPEAAAVARPDELTTDRPDVPATEQPAAPAAHQPGDKSDEDPDGREGPAETPAAALNGVPDPSRSGAPTGSDQGDRPSADAVPELVIVPDLAVRLNGRLSRGPQHDPAPEPVRESASYETLEEAMRAEPERPRSRPEPGPAYRTLHEWCRERTKIVPSGFTIHVYVANPQAVGYSYDLDPPEVPGSRLPSDRIGSLLHALWQEETDSEHGAWMFARIDAAGRTLRVDRWYDSIPAWWEGPIADRPIDESDVAWHLDHRSAAWQPSYASRLELVAHR